jgi:hypothetical protein
MSNDQTAFVLFLNFFALNLSARRFGECDFPRDPWPLWARLLSAAWLGSGNLVVLSASMVRLGGR